MINKVRSIVNVIRKIEDLANAIRKDIKNVHLDQSNYIRSQENDLKSHRILNAKQLIELNKQKKDIQPIENLEFQVFSQFGDDGIIQYIINSIDFPSKTFIEFGVETYKEANTRFLMINNNWSGMVIDGSENNINFIRQDGIYFAHEIYVKHSFITKENINGLLSTFPYGPEIGILSIDIDGNDYWVWKEINVVNPILVIVEYNSVFGANNPWTIPYEPSYTRTTNTSDVLVYGASLLSLCDLAEEKGYNFIGCNSAGNNAYFLRKDKMGSFKPLTSTEGYVLSKFSEYYDEEQKDRVRGENRFKIIKNKTIYNTRKKSIELI